MNNKDLLKKIKEWLSDNIRLLCANCYYSFNAYFPSAKKFCK